MKAASSAEPCLTGRCLGRAGGARGLAAEAAEDDRDEGAVHPLAHDVGEDRAGGADQRAGDDQRQIAEREADAGRRPARIGIEHRHDDRHVGAADRHDQQHAERQRGQRDQPEEDRRLGGDEQDDHQHERDAEAEIDDMALRQHDRLAGHASVELQEGDDRAGERHRADGEAERHFDEAGAVNVAALADAEGLRRIERAGRDEHGGEADQRVEHRDQLRHRRHLHGARAPDADAAADREAEHDQNPGEEAGGRTQGERRQDGDRHADHAEAVALAGSRRRRQAAQRENEQDAGDEIEEGGEVGAHLAASFFLYIASMRSVTRKPPNMFTDARISARKPTKRAKPEPLSTPPTPTDKQRADHDHRGNRVGDRHQRRVQRRRHRPDDVIADEHRQRENRQPEHERIDRAAGGGMAGGGDWSA